MSFPDANSGKPRICGFNAVCVAGILFVGGGQSSAETMSVCMEGECNVKPMPPMVTIMSGIPPAALSLCSQISDAKLNKNSSCLAVVKAKEPENVVGLMIEADEEYTISTSSKQIWHDASRVNFAPCGEYGSPWMNIFTLLKKAKDSLWFSLIAEIEGENKPYDLCHLDGNLRAMGSGRLILYANDAHRFYGNNSGEILVEIHRKK